MKDRELKLKVFEVILDYIDYREGCRVAHSADEYDVLVEKRNNVMRKQKEIRNELNLKIDEV